MYFLTSILTIKLLVYWLFSNAKLHSTELQSPIYCTALPRTNYLTHQITASNQYTASTVGRSGWESLSLLLCVMIASIYCGYKAIYTVSHVCIHTKSYIFVLLSLVNKFQPHRGFGRVR
jgi:hypothetical protein